VRQLVTPRSLANGLSSGFLLFAVFGILWLFPYPPPQQLQAQDVSATAPPAAAKAEIDQNSAELVFHDEPAKFQVNVKLVVVRVVVRDSQGHAVGGLHKEDFEVFDKGKPQTISQFEMEQLGSRPAKVSQESEGHADAASSETSSTAPAAGTVPQRFVAFLFDDVHVQFADLAQVRQAAERHLATLRPSDRTAIFTTSGLCCICSRIPSHLAFPWVNARKSAIIRPI
jgi:hypothetical protein